VSDPPSPGRRKFLLGTLLLPGLAACSSSSEPAATTGAAGTTGSTATARGTGSTGAHPSVSTTSPGAAGVLNVVAHQDDDLLFLSPALLISLHSGIPVRTVFLTAGDDGRAAPYWREREAGIRAAYAQMMGVPDNWRSAPSGLPDRTALTLAAAPQVGLVFLRLPDGGPGRGFPRYRDQSLPRLWRGEQSRIMAVDGKASYSRVTLIDTISRLMTFSNPKIVRTQDFHGRFGDGDHNDHHATAYLTRAASLRYATAHQLESYEDYATSSRRTNVPARLLKAKVAAFASYAAHDSQVCASGTSTCAISFRSWELRQYRLSTSRQPL